MRIQKLLIQNFKSINNSGEFTLEPKITTILGKNESGKTNILKALESFNEGYEYKEKDLCTYSEATKKLKLGEISAEDVPVITIWFEVDKEDKEKLKDLHPLAKRIKELKITKHFDNSYKIETPDIVSDLEKLKEQKEKKIEKCLVEIRTILKELKDCLISHISRHSPFAMAQASFEQILDDMNSYDPYDDEEGIDAAFAGFYQKLRGLQNKDNVIQADIESFIVKIEEKKIQLKEIIDSDNESWIDEILTILPTLVYFDTTEELTDKVSVKEFLQKRDKYKTLDNLITLAGLDVERLKDSEHYDRQLAEKEASTTITGLINESWEQEKVSIKVTLNSGDIVVSIEDEVGTLGPPSSRSQGFQWFLSFYINFTAGSKGEYKNTIILLDDPGVYLHPSGQRDLLKTLEKLSESNQIIFSTHSPFLIDRNRLERIRLVYKEENRIGTKIEEKCYKAKSDIKYDSLEPLRAAIGVTIGDSLFLTKKNILTEGLSDEIILRTFSHICKKNEKNYLDLDRISIFPTDGARKMPYFSMLLIKENVNFVVLLDNDKEGRKTAKELKEKFMVDDNTILTLDKIIEDPGVDCEIEDLIDFKLYLRATNEAYSEILRSKIRSPKIKESDLEEKKVAALRKFFKTNNLGNFDKIRVAQKLSSILITEEINVDLEVWDKLFSIINAKLG